MPDLVATEKSSFSVRHFPFFIFHLLMKLRIFKQPYPLESRFLSKNEKWKTTNGKSAL